MFSFKKWFKKKESESDVYMKNMQNDIRKLSNLVLEDTDTTNEEYILYEINKFKLSKKRKRMVDGERYYLGKHDILEAKRLVIGEDGELTEVKNLPNNHIIDNQYKKMVDQKSNYLLGKPFSIQSDDKDYLKQLKPVFNKKFKRTLKNVGQSSLNQGIAWLYPYYDEQGKLAFKRIEGYELIPNWKDSEHTILNRAIRIYETISIQNKKEKIIEKVELYTLDGIYCYVLDNNKLVSDKEPFKSYFVVKDNKKQTPYNWTKIPLIPFKANNKEMSLLNNVKSLQDGINSILSNFENNMEEDQRNTILILVNYDGENLGEFRRNLATYGAVKVRSSEGGSGDLRSLQVEVNADNYKAILELFKKALIENAMGYDAKDDRLGGNANQLNIKSMYSDIDLDANNMETEYQASFEELLWFINCYLSHTGKGDFEDKDIDIIFDRDMLMDESTIIDNINKSADSLSLETRVANHPWVDDPEKELERIKNEKEASIEQYNNAFTPTSNPEKESLDEEK